LTKVAELGGRSVGAVAVLLLMVQPVGQAGPVMVVSAVAKALKLTVASSSVVASSQVI
jgi:hypothetical protein